MHIKVNVKTGAKNESVRKLSDAHFEISVREKPRQNSANRRVLELVASQFGIPPSKVRIIKGHHRPSKILAINDKS